jgi:hypothetical protein
VAIDNLDGRLGAGIHAGAATGASLSIYLNRYHVSVLRNY